MKEKIVRALGFVAAITLVPVAALAQGTQQCISSNDKGNALRKQNKLLEARKELLACAAQSCPGPIRTQCAHDVDELEASIPTIVFQAKDGMGRDVSAVKVTVDGAQLAEKLDGSELEIDPGEHTFTFEAAGQAVVTQHYVIAIGNKRRRETIQLGGGGGAGGGGVAVNVVTPYGMGASATGGLIVEADRPGTVFVDDANAGHTPLRLASVYAGKHRVRVEFDEGGSSGTQRVLVSPNEMTTVNATLSEAASAFRYREGVRFGGSVGAMLNPPLHSSDGGYGVGLEPFVNIGVVPAFEIRFGIPVFLGANSVSSYPNGSPVPVSSTAFTFGFGGDLTLRFNVGPLYAMALGISVSYMNTGNDKGLLVMGEISPLVLRFGASKQFEASYTVGLGIFGDDPYFSNFLAFTFILPKFY